MTVSTGYTIKQPMHFTTNRKWQTRHLLSLAGPLAFCCASGVRKEVVAELNKELDMTLTAFPPAPENFVAVDKESAIHYFPRLTRVGVQNNVMRTRFRRRSDGFALYAFPGRVHCTGGTQSSSLV